MKIELCKHHNLPKVAGHFCVKCKEDLDRTSNFLNGMFSRLVLTSDKNGNPVLIKQKPPLKSSLTY